MERFQSVSWRVSCCEFRGDSSLLARKVNQILSDTTHLSLPGVRPSHRRSNDQTIPAEDRKLTMRGMITSLRTRIPHGRNRPIEQRSQPYSRFALRFAPSRAPSRSPQAMGKSTEREWRISESSDQGWLPRASARLSLSTNRDLCFSVIFGAVSDQTSIDSIASLIRRGMPERKE